jgi:hypothetical protein
MREVLPSKVIIRRAAARDEKRWRELFRSGARPGDASGLHCRGADLGLARPLTGIQKLVTTKAPWEPGGGKVGALKALKI